MNCERRFERSTQFPDFTRKRAAPPARCRPFVCARQALGECNFRCSSRTSGTNSGTGPSTGDVRRNLVDGQRLHRRRGHTPLREPVAELSRRADVDDTSEAHPRVRGRTHRAVLSRSEHRCRRTLVRRQILSRPPSQLELGVASVVAARDPVSILRQKCSVSRCQDGTERFVARIQCFRCQFDATTQVDPVRCRSCVRPLP